MDETLIIPMTVEENKVLFQLLNKYERIEKNTVHPYVKQISKQRQKNIMDLLGVRERE